MPIPWAHRSKQRRLTRRPKLNRTCPRRASPRRATPCSAALSCRLVVMSIGKRDTMRLLLLGEGAGSARYLLGVFARAQLDVRHVGAGQQLDDLTEAFDTVVFSDYPAKNLGQAAAEKIVRTVEAGAGLVM